MPSTSHSPGRRRALAQLLGLPLTGSFTSLASGSDVESLDKIDVHCHLSGDAPYLRAVMDEMGVKMVAMCNEGLKTERLAFITEKARRMVNRFPRYYGWCTTFNFEGFGHVGFGEDGWTERVRRRLSRHFDQGAVAVKVWREIGMQVRTPDGELVQIDDPLFDPVLSFIADRDRTLYAHIGDPAAKWLSWDENGRHDGWYRPGDGIWNRDGLFAGDVAYDDFIQARNRMLAKHPDLRVVGCHLGSLEFDVDLIGETLDTYPNFAVETAGRMESLMNQNREKVRHFFETYQDRLLWGTDITGGPVPSRWQVDPSRYDERKTADEMADDRQALIDRYRREFTYYGTDERIERDGYAVRGLDLPTPVLEKFFYRNAARWIPGVDREF